MAKSKSRKNQKDKQAVENEILMYIYALVLIALSIIGLLKIGPVGQITTNIVQYIFGNMYGIFYACVIIISFMMMLKKSLQELPLKQTIGLAVLLCAWLLLAAIPKDETLKGMDVVNYYLSNSSKGISNSSSAGSSSAWMRPNSAARCFGFGFSSRSIILNSDSKFSSSSASSDSS